MFQQFCPKYFKVTDTTEAKRRKKNIDEIVFVGKYSCVCCISKLLFGQIKFQTNAKFEMFLLQELQLTLLQLLF